MIKIDNFLYYSKNKNFFLYSKKKKTTYTPKSLSELGREEKKDFCYNIHQNHYQNEASKKKIF